MDFHRYTAGNTRAHHPPFPRRDLLQGAKTCRACFVLSVLELTTLVAFWMLICAPLSFLWRRHPPKHAFTSLL